MPSPGMVRFFSVFLQISYKFLKNLDKICKNDIPVIQNMKGKTTWIKKDYQM